MLTLDVSQQLNHFTLTCKQKISNQGITGLLGPSGSGKTSLLRIIAGLSSNVLGSIKLGDKTLFDSTGQINISAHHREIGFVFQDDRLFPHLSVKQNLVFAQSKSIWKKQSLEFTSAFNKLIESAGIKHLLNVMPAQLSAGERQRVALLRAIFAKPKLLLLDEPLAHLDSHSKHQMILLIKTINEQLALPMIYISHDHFEIQQLADDVLVMEQGQIIQQGNVHQVLNNLDDKALHEYSVQTSLELQVHAQLDEYGLTQLSLPHTENSPAIFVNQTQLTVGHVHRFFIKAQAIALSIEEPKTSSMVNCLAAVVTQLKERDTKVIIKAKLANHPQEFNLSISKYSKHKLAIELNSSVYLQFKASALHFL